MPCHVQDTASRAESAIQRKEPPLPAVAHRSSVHQFTRWARAAGGFLAHHGVSGFLANAGELEDADTIKRRIDQAARYVPLDQLCLSPQCGFSSTVEGNVLSYDEQVAKLRLVVQVARDVWATDRTSGPVQRLVPLAGLLWHPAAARMFIAGKPRSCRLR
jgi:hypothetical protein